MRKCWIICNLNLEEWELARQFRKNLILDMIYMFCIIIDVMIFMFINKNNGKTNIIKNQQL